MSLDVSLYTKEPIYKSGSGIFVRDNGSNRELNIVEVKKLYPDIEIHNETIYETNCVFSANITHNLNKMADAAGIYYACWRPEEIGAVKASDILPILKEGYCKLKSNPEYYREFDSDNGWGVYDDFLPWVEKYLNACIEYPDAIIEADR